jgi:serine/threonine protein kinase/tetratricopeptide (TPR) repeat protein
MIGETISHYRITEKLGAGGMGIVYKAQDLQLERFVALKFLPKDLSLTEIDRDRFLREARSASALDHPNIGVIHGIETTDDGHMFIVMAYYDGQTLSQKLSAGPLTLRQALDWICQIAAGLAAAHARNIVHRDIKPSNIIITRDNSARIVDFGLARVVATPSATMTGGITGTLPYMSPEQILGESVDQRCDVWALAILLVQVVTGSHPFARESSTAMSFAILNQAPGAIDGLPALLQPIALHGLAKEAARRYADAKEMLVDLESARAQFSTFGIPLDEPTLTHSASAPISAALKEVISHASTPRWQAGTAAAQAAVASAAQPKSRNVAPYFLAALGVIVLAAGSLLFPAVRQRLAATLAATAGAKHVAVLPFDNIGKDPANEAVAGGLMDSLTSKLSNLDAQQQSLWVVPSSVVRSRKVTDPSAAGKDLGANLVVKGSIRRDGKNVQLTVNLIDAKDLRQVGSAVLDDATGDLAVLQDEAVARLGRMMKINVSAEMLRATGGRASPAAYELYLKALGLMQRYDKPGNLDQAVTALQDAVKNDSQFALGYASLGEAYRLKNQVDPNPRWIEQASAMLDRAVQLDNNLSSAHVTLGRLHDASGKYDLAQQEFQQALRLDKRNAEALGGLARSYESAGRLADAEASLKRAIDLRPDYWDGYNNLAIFYDGHNRYDEAITQLQKAIALTPDNAQLYLNLGAVYSDTGKVSDQPAAEAALRKSIELAPSYPAYANLGFVYSLQNRYSEAAAMTEKALQLNDQNYLVWRNLAEDYLWAKDSGKAAEAHRRELELLQKAVDMQPNDAELLSELATLYAQQQAAGKAQTLIAKAIALSPDSGTALMNAAEVSERLGNRAESIRYAELGLQKGFSLDDLKKRYALQALLADPNFKAPAGK